MAAQNASVTAKSSCYRKKKRSTVQPTLSKAVAYSAKVGAVTNARRGFLAQTSRKMRSAAPLPQRICSAGKRCRNGLCHPFRQAQRADVGRKIQRIPPELGPVTGPIAAMY